MDPRNWTYEEPEEKSFEPLPKGTYPFTILEVNSMTTTKKGDPMLPVKFEFHGPDDHRVHVYENFVFTDAAAWKVNQFLKCICGGTINPGRQIDFESAEFIKWLMARRGTASLSIERVQGKTKDYDRNKVDAFLYEKSAAAPAPAPAPVAAGVEDDDSESIPF
jgi:hypothetical protein